jgi:hypothetical protein
MTIIRITQKDSITHTEFELREDYKPMPEANFDLACQWADSGLLTEFDAGHLMMLENQRNYYAAIRQIRESKECCSFATGFTKK